MLHHSSKNRKLRSLASAESFLLCPNCHLAKKRKPNQRKQYDCYQYPQDKVPYLDGKVSRLGAWRLNIGVGVHALIAWVALIGASADKACLIIHSDCRPRTSVRTSCIPCRDRNRNGSNFSPPRRHQTRMEPMSSKHSYGRTDRAKAARRQAQ